MPCWIFRHSQCRNNAVLDIPAFTMPELRNPNAGLYIPAFPMPELRISMPDCIFRHSQCRNSESQCRVGCSGIPNAGSHKSQCRIGYSGIPNVGTQNLNAGLDIRGTFVATKVPLISDPHLMKKEFMTNSPVSLCVQSKPKQLTSPAGHGFGGGAHSPPQ